METVVAEEAADGAGAAVRTGEEEGAGAAPALAPGEGPCGAAGGGSRVSRPRGH